MTKLKELRKRNGLSQSELANASGVNYRVLQDYEQGRKHLSQAKTDMVIRLSHVLGCTVEELVEIEDAIIFGKEYVEEIKQKRLIPYFTGCTNQEAIGCVNIEIDEIVPCLRDNETGELVDTAVIRIESRSYLKSFNKSNGWHIDWNKVSSNIEVYALITKSSNLIQGLVGIKNDIEADAAYIYWMCTSPHNNKHENGTQKYTGVGGHLFAIAVDKSLQWGHDGAIHGFAASEELLKMYCDRFGGEYIGMLHPFQFMIDGQNARELLEVYNYEWNG